MQPLAARLTQPALHPDGLQAEAAGRLLVDKGVLDEHAALGPQLQPGQLRTWLRLGARRECRAQSDQAAERSQSAAAVHQSLTRVNCMTSVLPAAKAAWQ